MIGELILETSNVVFDTTYILPFFGVDVGIPNLKNLMKKILLTKEPKIGISISSCSFIETKWILLSEYKKKQNPLILGRYSLALKSLLRSPRISVYHSFLDERSNMVADHLRIAGLTDIMDGWIAGTAYTLNYPLVTEDEELRKIISETEYENKLVIISWEEFAQQFQI